MAFVEGTKLLTDQGWKNIESIAGRDRVLVRNFIGDASLVVPFALRKMKYSGDVYRYNGKLFDVAITPDHWVDYIYSPNDYSKKGEEKRRADQLSYKYEHIYRGHRYILDSPLPKQYIILKDGAKAPLPWEDWVRFIVYFLTRGYITDRKQLQFRIRTPEDMENIGQLLNKYNIHWNKVGKQRYIYVSSRNNLIRKYIKLLGSANKDQATLSNDFIFGMPSALQRQFIELYLELGATLIEKRNRYYIYLSNPSLVDSLMLMAHIAGYSASSNITFRPGSIVYGRETDKTIYRVVVMKPLSMVKLIPPKVQPYNGYVYNLDLFEGSVFVKNKQPVWMSPR